MLTACDHRRRHQHRAHVSIKEFLQSGRQPPRKDTLGAEGGGGGRASHQGPRVDRWRLSRAERAMAHRTYLKGTLLHADTATNAQDLRDEGQLVRPFDFDADLAHSDHGAALLALLRTLLWLAFLMANDGWILGKERKRRRRGRGGRGHSLEHCCGCRCQLHRACLTEVSRQGNEPKGEGTKTAVKATLDTTGHHCRNMSSSKCVQKTQELLHTDTLVPLFAGRFLLLLLLPPVRNREAVEEAQCVQNLSETYTFISQAGLLLRICYR